MSKSSAASAPKLSTPLPQRSAWSRGPPNTSSAPTPRTQSPAPASTTSSATPSHSRRPSTLGQGVAFKDGVAGARSPVGAPKSGSAVTFGSIDDASAPLSSSPASVPPIKPEPPKTFGSVSAQPTTLQAVNGKQAPSQSASTSVSASAKPSTPSSTKFDVKKLFQGSSSGPSPSSSSSQPSEPVSSPSTRPAPLPTSSSQSSSSHTPQSSQFGSHSFQTFVPGSGLRPSPNGTNGSVPPRSPVYPRQQPNGAAPPQNVNGRPQGAPGSSPAPPTPMSAGMPSPRMGPPHPGQPAGMPPGQVPAWNAYYYPYPNMPPEYMYAQPWQMPHTMPPPHPHPHTPGGQPPPHQQPHPHGQPGLPMSPRHPASALHPPGTPTMTPAVPVSTASPHVQTTSLSAITSPPSTPASATGPGAAGQMNQNAKPFVPRKVVIKNSNGLEVDLESFKKHGSSGSVSGFQSPVAAVPGSPARKAVPIRMETEEAKNKRLAEEEKARKEKEEAERAKREAEEKAKRDEEERVKKEKEEKERAQREKEEAERKQREEEEKERVRKEQEEKEKLRKEEEEKERLRKEAEEKERARKEAEEKAQKEAEERERQKKEAEERARKEAEEKEKAAAAAAEASAPAASEAPSADAPTAAEEGEVDEKDPALQDETRDKVQDKPPLRLDTTLDKKRPGPLDLSGTKGPIPQPLPSALATARIIEDIASIEYPEGILSPKVELNVNAKQGKFRYDRDFLLQFMAVCKEKPDSLPPLDAIGLEPTDQSYAMTRGGSGRRQPSISGMGPPSSTAPRQASVGLGISGFNKQSGFTMGQFATPKSSEERFAMANRSSSMSGGPAGMPFGRPSPMVRSSSQGGPGGVPMGSNRTRSKRGEKRGGNNAPSQPTAFGNNAAQQAAMLEPVAPLEVSANRWTPASITKKGAAVDEDSPEIVERKVKSLLNKLTMEKFDSISDQIIAWANKSEKEKDGRTLIQVIKLVFEKATDEATWSEMYARLCRKMMEQISPKVQDDGIRNAEGKHITGGHLFRKYLLNRCQEDFERGWASKESTAAAAASKATEDAAAKQQAEGTDEVALYSEEYYAAQKAKRQGLGLIKFIGELFKLQMLTERIMHECVKKLLGNVENPEEEEIESLCKLLTTVGALLDTPKARAHMDVYFSRMKELTKSPNVNSRMQFMLQDVIELRERKWVSRNQAAAPTTLAAVHEAAAKEKASQEKESYNRTLSMSRGGSRRGGERGEQQVGPDGWAVAGGSVRAPPKAGDLSNFGKISKAAPMTFGPSSVFAGKKESKRDSTVSRAGGNMFSMLSQNPELVNEVQSAPKGSRPPSRKASIDLGSGGAPDASGAAPQRRRLNLLPRSVPKADESKEDTPAASTAPSEDESEAAGPSMSEAEAKKRIEEDSKEFFSIRDLEEAEVYFTKLPAEHRHLLVDKLVGAALESKEADAELVANFFSRAASKNICSPATFEQGFAGMAEFLDDIAVDAPKAPQYFIKMLQGAGLDKDEERRTRLLSKSMDSEKLLGMLA